MDHARPRGLAALAIVTLLISTSATGGPDGPPASGVGGASLDATEAPATPTAEVATPETEPTLDDPTALAARIAARLDARDTAATATDATTTTADPITPASTETPAVETAASAAPLPAPRATGERFIDRFAPSASTSEDTGSTATDESASAAGEAWWNAPELRVGLLLAAFVGIAVVMRRWSNTRGPRAGRPSGVVSVLARYPFGRGASLVLLEVGPRVVLVHQHGGRGGDVRPVAEFTSPEEIAEIRARLGMSRRAEEPGFGRDLQAQLGLYDRRGRPAGFGGTDGLPLDDAMETVDLTRRRPRRGTRTH